MKDRKAKKAKKTKEDLKPPVIPETPAATELSEEDLKKVTGGYDWIKKEATEYKPQ